MSVASRREFLEGSGRLLGSLIVGGLLLEPAHSSVEWRGALERGLGGAAARRLGRAYCEAVPAEASRAALERHLVRSLGTGRMGTSGLRARLRARAREDFAAGRVVRLDGWRLSLCEARACALLALG